METAAGKLQWVLWILRHSSAADLPRLWEQFAGEDSDLHVFQLAIVSRWMRLDPKGGMAFFSAKAEGSERRVAGERPRWVALGLWLGRDWDGAYAFENWNESDRGRAIRFLAEFAPGSVFCERIERRLPSERYNLHGLGDYAQEDPEVAMAFAKGLTDPFERLAAIMIVYRESDPEAGLDYLTKIHRARSEITCAILTYA